MPGEIISEHRARSNRNGGRHHRGFAGDFPRNPQAGRLFEIARALSMPITYFYDGIGDEGPRLITLHQRMQLEITRNFAEIRNEKHQNAVSQLARALATR